MTIANSAPGARERGVTRRRCIPLQLFTPSQSSPWSAKVIKALRRIGNLPSVASDEP